LGRDAHHVLGIAEGFGFAYGRVEPNAEDVLLNVGANVVVQRKRVEAVAFLEGRAKEIENSVVSLLSQRNQIAARLEADRQALQAMVSRQNQKN